MSTFKPNNELTLIRLKTLLRYDPRTGIFFWISDRARVAKAGDEAGSVTSAGYVRITVDGHRFMAHVLAWFYMTGEYVVRGIDHRDVDGTNNRWINLRRATKSQNCMNRKTRRDNALGVKCVLKKKGRISKPYYATIKVDGKQRQLGYCATIEEAAATYREAAVKNFGEFARLK